MRKKLNVSIPESRSDRRLLNIPNVEELLKSKKCEGVCKNDELFDDLMQFFNVDRPTKMDSGDNEENIECEGAKAICLDDFKFKEPKKMKGATATSSAVKMRDLFQTYYVDVRVYQL